ncbi:hypothetical protein D3C72_2223300 [compost metagenome]
MIATLDAEIDRPTVGEVADCFGHALSWRDALAALPVDQPLASAGIDVDYRDVMGIEQCPARSL